MNNCYNRKRKSYIKVPNCDIYYTFNDERRELNSITYEGIALEEGNKFIADNYDYFMNKQNIPGEPGTSLYYRNICNGILENTNKYNRNATQNGSKQIKPYITRYVEQNYGGNKNVTVLTDVINYPKDTNTEDNEQRRQNINILGNLRNNNSLASTSSNNETTEISRRTEYIENTNASENNDESSSDESSSDESSSDESSDESSSNDSYTYISSGEESYTYVSSNEESSSDENDNEEEEENINGPKNIKMKESSENCSICLETSSNCVLIPCGHKCICSKCSIKLRKTSNSNCPICRTTIQNSLKIN